jgi:hypothetical protein
MPRTKIVEVANENVSIVTVCRMLGVDLPDGDYLSRRKVHCLFGGLYHSDGGVAAAMRVYADANYAYCFNCATKYTPVSLAARALDLDWRTAAVRLLDRVGYRPLDLITQFQQARDFEPELNRALLADALKTYCRRICPSWSRMQFERSVAATLDRCFTLLDLVHTPDDVIVWLTRCKTVMSRLLNPEKPSLSQPEPLLLDPSAHRRKEHHPQ